MKEKIAVILIFLSILTSSLYFGLPRLRNFSGVDEPYWSYDRVPQFWNSIKTQNWKSTNICDKPGIPLAIISGTGLSFISQDIKELGKLRYEPKTVSELNAIRDIYHKLRFPVFIFTLLVLPIFYFLIRKLLGENTANFALIFIGLSPVLLGISLIINSDAILWILTALSTLSLFNFFKSDNKKYLILSGFILGLSVITKYVANMLFIYFFLLFFLEYIFYAHQKIEVGKYLKQSFLNYLTLFASAMATAFIFFPATWVKISVLFNATIGNPVFSSTWPIFMGIILLLGVDTFLLKNKIFSYIFKFLIRYKRILSRSIVAIFVIFTIIVFLHVFLKINIYNIQEFISSPKGIGIDLDTIDASVKTITSTQKMGSFWIIANQYVGSMIADLYSLMFSISPLILCLILAPIFFIFRKKEIDRDLITVIYIIIFILFFYLGSALNNVTTTVRYQIMTYPLVFVMAAIGMVQLLKYIKIKENLKFPVAYIFSILILLTSLFQIKPDFLAYASEILPKDYIVNLKGMGEGSFEAGSYLNTLPNAHEMTIWSDKGAVCEAFVGKCYIDFKNKTFKENNFDYFAISTDRMSRSLKMSNGGVGKIDFEKLYSAKNSEFEIIIGQREINFVKVIKNSSLIEKQNEN
ncbi:MAG: glycosyltransferase family 39 protein [bacterium]|nr:glycosyltransferase family 39 protein [bacterium]